MWTIEGRGVRSSYAPFRGAAGGIGFEFRIDRKREICVAFMWSQRR